VNVSDPDDRDGTLARFCGVPILLIFLVLLLLATGLSFGSGEFKGEEGRRAIAAREMISSGDYLVPTVWGQPYLNKPPGYPWLVALCGHLTGGVNPQVVRIPAFLSFLGLAILMYFLGRRWGGVEGGILTAFLMVSSIEMQKKAMIGETDMLLTIGIALYALGMIDREWKWSHGICACSGLLIAGFAKGPAALPFVGGIILALFLKDGYSRRLLWISVGPLLVMGATLSLWYLLLQNRLADLDVWSHWQSETLRQRLGETTILSSQHLWEFVFGTVLGFLPSSLVLLEPKRWLSSWKENGWPRAAILSALLVPFVIFFFWPGTQPRYLLPLMPLMCGWAGYYFLTQKEGLGIRLFSWIFRVLMTTGGAFVLYLAWFNSEFLGMAPSISQSILLTIAALTTVTIALISENQCKMVQGGALSRILLLTIIASAFNFIWVIPTRKAEAPARHSAETTVRDFAQWIESRVPATSTVWLDVNHNWNELASVDRSIIWITESDQGDAEDWVLKKADPEGDPDAMQMSSGTWVVLKPWSEKETK